MKTHRMALLASVAMLVVTLAVGSAWGGEDPSTLKIYLMGGQSNSQGHGYAHYEGGNVYNIPTLEFLLDSTPAANTYRANMPTSTFTFKPYLNASWMNARNDVWAVQYRSASGAMEQVEPTPSTNQGAWYTAIGPLSPGFGASNSMSTLGPELGMGIRLGEALQSPVLIMKSNEGGTTLGYNWRPPSAVSARGGSVGVNYTNTITRFKELLDTLDADLADDGKLNAYNNATGYRVAGFVWFQGWNEMFNDAFKAEYAQNLVDLAHDIRNADLRIPKNLGIIIPESADQNVDLNAGRVAAVAALNAEKPGTAVFFENNNMTGSNWGNNNSGAPFSTSWGYHFNAKAENYLEIGWRMGQAALDNNFIPEPATMALLALGGLAVLRRRRNR